MNHKNIGSVRAISTVGSSTIRKGLGHLKHGNESAITTTAGPQSSAILGSNMPNSPDRRGVHGLHQNSGIANGPTALSQAMVMSGYTGSSHANIVHNNAAVTL